MFLPECTINYVINCVLMTQTLWWNPETPNSFGSYSIHLCWYSRCLVLKKTLTKHNLIEINDTTMSWIKLLEDMDKIPKHNTSQKRNPKPTPYQKKVKIFCYQSLVVPRCVVYRILIPTTGNRSELCSIESHRVTPRRRRQYPKSLRLHRARNVNFFQ